MSLQCSVAFLFQRGLLLLLLLVMMMLMMLLLLLLLMLLLPFFSLLLTGPLFLFRAQRHRPLAPFLQAFVQAAPSPS